MELDRADSSFIRAEERQVVLRALNLRDAPLLGIGTEAEVYGRDEHTVLKLYADVTRLPHFETLQRFYESIDTGQSELSFPRIHDISRYGNLIAIIESRIQGYPLNELLETMDKVDHDRAEDLYLDTLWELKQVQITASPKTYLLFDKDGISEVSRQSFESFYSQFLEQKIQRIRPFFASGYPSFPEKAVALIDAIRDGKTATLSVVHGDYFPGNILVNKALSQTHGVIDFGSFTLFGNYLLDVAGAFGFYRMYDSERFVIRQRLLAKILQRLKPEEEPVFFRYLLANAVLTSDLYASDADPRNDDHFRWAAEIVSNDSYWEQAL